ncbi:MAG TPA: hypothetical protein VGQ39_01340 [Pyrinomonadaceae bacterium]|nr:hypothetical protein [Pyrinomonadaceae bacterium]
MQKSSTMLKLILGLIAIACFVVPTALGKITTAQDPPAKEPAKQKAETVTINGKVSAVTETTVTVVDDQKAEQTVAIDGKTKITKAGKAATAADIKADDAVVVVASKGEGNSLTAIAIKIS